MHHLLIETFGRGAASDDDYLTRVASVAAVTLEYPLRDHSPQQKTHTLHDIKLHEHMPWKLVIAHHVEQGEKYDEMCHRSHEGGPHHAVHLHGPLHTYRFEPLPRRDEGHVHEQPCQPTVQPGDVGVDQTHRKKHKIKYDKIGRHEYAAQISTIFARLKQCVFQFRLYT